MDDERSVSDTEVWDRLLGEQTALFKRTAFRNAELESRVEELERELSVWKAALKVADEETKTLNKTVLKLERSIGSLRDDNPLILCLIDGDGNIFSPELITLGQAGGRQAAMLLTHGLTDHLASIDSDALVPGRGQVWLTIYCNKSGLLDTLTHNNFCTTEQFETFVLGFNQASPLFSIVDVGYGKEAADSKIKECLRVFTRFPQTSRVFFGGAHDNGYTSTLNYLQNEGLLHKVILLRGYRDLAHELRSLNLPQLEIQGVFMTRRIQNNPFRKNSAPVPVPGQVQPQDFDKFRSKTVAAPSPLPVSRSVSPVKKVKRLDPDLPLHKQRPPPCNFYYLSECQQGDKCRYSHDYILLSEQLNELRVNAKKWPCPLVNRDLDCTLGEKCCMSHVCPKGPRCSFFKQAKCKFVGRDMHRVNPAAGNANIRNRQSSSSTATSSSPAMSAVTDAHLPPISNPLQHGYYLSGGDSGSSATTQMNNGQQPSLLSRLNFHTDGGFSFPGY
ncbi:hypothetical protein CERSUDRAFT_79626 [Gelatoporia subvermispora B]|uniref:C3H1-type domain-containing protein n=1 Tax=Ceriporiopsis subvermispora (strain B) TaxID=914234 RepID=M2QY24_CERS8|nr:hypothetical protein CERSUDRAFT_79626 [Gelatoporia subvermispora B]